MKIYYKIKDDKGNTLSSGYLRGRKSKIYKEIYKYSSQYMPEAYVIYTSNKEIKDD